ncbi:MAG: substrate-binding domain-containing protein, partial [Lacipirellulaceae bacterium]
WRGDGIIARISTPPQQEEILNTKLPSVNVDDVYANRNRVGNVLTNQAEKARLAIDHFRERGMTKFAYYAPPSNEYSRCSEVEFVKALAEIGTECHVYKPGYRVSRRIGRDEQHRRILRWLNQLPRPVAILAVDARRGRELTEVFSMEGIAVPDEVAILAGDTDDLLCELSSPPLSSIVVASQKLGYEAAAMLHRMIHEGETPSEPE